MMVSLCVDYPSLFYLTEPGCNIRSGDRELCRLDLTAPFVNPGNCPLECYYDDMFMSEPSVKFYNREGRIWCFKRQ